MPSVFDQRLSSLLHQATVWSVEREERVVEMIGREYVRMGRAVLRAASVPKADYLSQVDEVIVDTMERVETKLRASMAQALVDSYQWASVAMIEAVPWGWFRRINPVIVERAEPAQRFTKAQKQRIISQLIFPTLSAQVIDDRLSKVSQGMTWDDRLRSWGSQSRSEIRDAVQAGVASAEGLHKMSKRLETAVGGVRYKAMRIARTESRRIGEIGHQEAYREAGDLISAMQVVATLDKRTRPEHRARHGRLYHRQPDGAFVSNDGEAFPDLPDAPNCRCYGSPILTVPAELADDPLIQTQFANARQEVIPDPSVYVRWWGTASTRQQRLAVGSELHATVSSRVAGVGRAPEWADFLNEDGSLMTVNQARRQSVAKWEKRRAGVDRLIGNRAALVRQAEQAGAGLGDVALGGASPKTAAELERRLATMKAENETKRVFLATIKQQTARKAAALDRVRQKTAAKRAAAARLKRKLKQTEAEAERLDRRLGVQKTAKAAPRIEVPSHTLSGRIKAAAGEYGVEQKAIRESLEVVAEERIEAAKRYQEAKAAAHKTMGLSSSDIRGLEDRGFDYTSSRRVKALRLSAKQGGGQIGEKLERWDVFAEEVSRQHPELGLGHVGDSNADPSRALWDVLRNPRPALPRKIDLIDEAAEHAAAASRYDAEAEVGSFGEFWGDEDEVPF